MPIHQELKYAPLEDLYLDTKNPRLGREITSRNLSQNQLLDIMKNWTLDELAISFLESGYWIQEPLLVTKETLYGQERLVVVEGNRRLAALKLLFSAKSGHPASRRWQEIAATGSETVFAALANVPYLQADSRNDIQSYLGFRHVTGIKEWDPAQKAEFISKLIDEQGMTYQQVMRKIGSKTETVRRNYISYRVRFRIKAITPA